MRCPQPSVCDPRQADGWPALWVNHVGEGERHGGICEDSDLREDVHPSLPETLTQGLVRSMCTQPPPRAGSGLAKVQGFPRTSSITYCHTQSEVKTLCASAWKPCEQGSLGETPVWYPMQLRARCRDRLVSEGARQIAPR